MAGKKNNKKKKGTPVDPNNKSIAENRTARRNYEITDTLEAGIVLVGTEVKSCREGKVQLADSFLKIKNGEAWLQSCHIAEYTKQGGYLNHKPTRDRKLLLHNKEIFKLAKRLDEKGLSCVPLKVYFKKGFVKVLLGIGKGRSSIDKRGVVKKRDADREIARAFRR